MLPQVNNPFKFHLVSYLGSSLRVSFPGRIFRVNFLGPDLKVSLVGPGVILALPLVKWATLDHLQNPC